jgi:sarcosine oxidase subunit beta
VLANIPIVEAFADRLETITADGIPIIDRLPGAQNMIVTAGWSGHGWAIAPSVATLLADWAFTGNRPELLAPFSYSRFKRPV